MLQDYPEILQPHFSSDTVRHDVQHHITTATVHVHAKARRIPLGSVMGPLLFNIVINDLKSATSKFDLVMYADDSTLVSTLENFGDRNNAKEIEQNINKEIYKITTWLHSNKLRLNVSLSKFMIFFKHPKVTPKLNISINVTIPGCGIET